MNYLTLRVCEVLGARWRVLYASQGEDNPGGNRPKIQYCEATKMPPCEPGAGSVLFLDYFISEQIKDC